MLAPGWGTGTRGGSPPGVKPVSVLVDVEDCIEFVLHLDTTKRFWWLRLLPSCSCGKPVAELPLDEAVTQTTLLRARVVDVSQRNIRYNLIVDSASKPMAAMDPVQKAASASTSSFDILTVF
jgi:hypothetical protein